MGRPPPCVRRALSINARGAGIFSRDERNKRTMSERYAKQRRLQNAEVRTGKQVATVLGDLGLA